MLRVVRFICCSACLAALATVLGCGSSSSDEGSEPLASNVEQQSSDEQATAATEAAPASPPPVHVSPAVRAEHEMEAKARANGEEVEQYAGLGAPKSQFKAHNTVIEGEGPSEPAAGSTEDSIERLSTSGRVTKYQRTLHFEPPASNAEKLRLVDGIDLPDDARVVRETSTCMDWHSSTLRILIGKSYAEASTASEVPIVTMEAVSSPTC